MRIEKEQVREKYHCSVYAKVRPENLPIVRLLEKMNFVPDPVRIAQGNLMPYRDLENVG